MKSTAARRPRRVAYLIASKHTAMYFDSGSCDWCLLQAPTDHDQQDAHHNIRVHEVLHCVVFNVCNDTLDGGDTFDGDDTFDSGDSSIKHVNDNPHDHGRNHS
eukprot:m.621630 g.621630  ORF g.621630 m.621630 type:complete len:103 (+) comp58215_c0_seq44:1723-2031(+)